MKLHTVIRNFITSHLEFFEESPEFSDHDDIFELGFVSSLFAMQLVTFVQEQFGVDIKDDDINLSNFSSVNSIVHLIQKKQHNNDRQTLSERIEH
jgi:methoxymalonate biosynthesis acyl carrier protein